MTRVKARPPIGIMPERIWRRKIIRERIQELQDTITRYRADCLQVDPNWENELFKHRRGLLVSSLGEIESVQDFEKILNQEFRTFMGSRRRCAEELKKSAPKKKQDIIATAIFQLSKDRNWNFAGD